MKSKPQLSINKKKHVGGAYFFFSILFYHWYFSYFPIQTKYTRLMDLKSSHVISQIRAHFELDFFGTPVAKLHLHFIFTFILWMLQSNIPVSSNIYSDFVIQILNFTNRE